MVRPPADARLLLLSLDRDDPRPLYRQVYDGIRSAILSGRLGPGARLPSTRALSGELGVSRNTVLSAFEQLVAEGYLDARIGGGSHVAADLARPGRDGGSSPRRGTDGQRPPGSTGSTGSTGPTGSNGTRADGARRTGHLAARLHELTAWSTVRPEPTRPFQLGLPSLDEFPARIWSRLLSRNQRRVGIDLWRYGSSLGYEPLRLAICEYLRASRGVVCEPDQVLITSGSQQALELSSRILLDPGETAWIEEPGYLGARCALSLAGARLVGVPVDADGMQWASAAGRDPKPRVIYVTPSHQFPSGVSLTLKRRLELLRLAEEWDSWILEDDYDSEFRYQGAPIPSLQGLDRSGRVIYVGTFSKTLAPALRLGYLVLPPDLVEPFVTLRSITDQHAPTLEQAAAADFLAEGHFATHVARMRRLYGKRRETLIEALREELGDEIEVCGTGAGLHLMVRLPEGIDDERVFSLALDQGIKATPLSCFHLRRPARGGLVLGYAAFGEEESREATRKLAEAVRGARNKSSPLSPPESAQVE